MKWTLPLEIALLMSCSLLLVAQTAPSSTEQKPQSGYFPSPYGRVYRVGGEVSAPKAVYEPDPEYTKEARKAKIQGTCVVWLIIGADGLTHDIRVAHSLDHGLDEKAIEEVQRWKFKPAMKDGKPVSVQANIEAHFKLIKESQLP